MARSGLTPLSPPFSLSLTPLNWGPLLASAELQICGRCPKQELGVRIMDNGLIVGFLTRLIWIRRPSSPRAPEAGANGAGPPKRPCNELRQKDQRCA